MAPSGAGALAADFDGLAGKRDFFGAYTNRLSPGAMTPQMPSHQASGPRHIYTRAGDLVRKRVLRCYEIVAIKGFNIGSQPFKVFLP